MIDETRAKRSIAEHIQWCREERDELAADLARFEAGPLYIGESGAGTRDSMTRTEYLRRSIEQLDDVVRAFAV